MMATPVISAKRSGALPYCQLSRFWFCQGCTTRQPTCRSRRCKLQARLICSGVRNLFLEEQKEDWEFFAHFRGKVLRRLLWWVMSKSWVMAITECNVEVLDEDTSATVQMKSVVRTESEMQYDWGLFGRVRKSISSCGQQYDEES